jgi:hypothetical protein
MISTAAALQSWVSSGESILQNIPPAMRVQWGGITGYIRERGLMGARVCLEFIHRDDPGYLQTIKLYFERSQP